MATESTLQHDNLVVVLAREIAAQLKWHGPWRRLVDDLRTRRLEVTGFEIEVEKAANRLQKSVRTDLDVLMKQIQNSFPRIATFPGSDRIRIAASPFRRL